MINVSLDGIFEATVKILSSKEEYSNGDFNALFNDILETVSNTNRAVEKRENPIPAVPIAESIQHDYLVCLEDSTKHRSMKRHLRINFKLTPEQYRAKWGLPKDYPMTCPEYTARRSEIARNTGLGRKK